MSSETRHPSAWTERTALLENERFDRIARHGKRAVDALLYSSAYLAVIAAVEVAIATLLLGLPPTPAPLVVGLVTFAVYATDRIADAETDSVSNPRQADFSRRYGDVLYVAAAGAYGLAVAVSVIGGPAALAVTLVPGAFWLLYASDWLPALGPCVQRFKDVLVVNTTVVALAWALTLTGLPLAFADAAVTPAAGVVFAYFFLGTFVNSEIPNVRDVEGDRAIGVATLPVVLGVCHTRRLLYAIDVVVAGLVGYAVLVDFLSVALAVGLLVGLAYSLGVTAALGRYENAGRLTLAAECEYVFVAAALLPAAGV